MIAIVYEKFILFFFCCLIESFSELKNKLEKYLFQHFVHPETSNIEIKNLFLKITVV